MPPLPMQVAGRRSHALRAASRAAVALVALALVPPGCIGLGVIGTYRAEDETLPFQHAETDRQLRARRGEPDSIERVAESTERWTYCEDLRWAGVVPIVVIPIPLALPVGREHVVYTLEDGAVRGATHVRQRWSGRAWGLVGHRFGYDSWDVHD